MQHPCAELQGVLLLELSVLVGVTLIIARSAAHCFGNDVDATSTPYVAHKPRLRQFCILSFLQGARPRQLHGI